MLINRSDKMNNLKTARLDKGLSQQNVADYMNINQSTYSYWESGRSKIDNVSIKKLSKLFGVSVDYLLGVTDEIKPYPKKVN